MPGILFAMPVSGIKVLTLGQRFKLPYETRHLDQPTDLIGTLARFRPDVIVTSTFIPGALDRFAFEWRKRWIHVKPEASAEDVQKQIEASYAFYLWNKGDNAAFNPLVSVYTAAWNSGDHLRETYTSLREQTYANWEWVVVDDGSEDETWKRLVSYAEEDPRVRPMRAALRQGKIGASKDQATRLCRGEFLVELDHDDMLVDTALREIVTAFRDHPDVGMVYSNSSNFFENGQFHRYPDPFWKDRYRETEYRGKKWLECLNPNIYDRFGPNYWEQFGYTLSVGPNHVRAFRASTFRELGGYNPELAVADDWDLFARFFLRSNCLHLDRMLYLYRFKDNWSNTTFTRNQAIQDHLKLGQRRYAGEFDAFNKSRSISGKLKPDEVLLTIAVPAISERFGTSLPAVMTELFRQAEGLPVEVLCVLDNKARNLSQKRNDMIAAAKGRFIAFVDDDDRVEPGYAAELVAAIRKNPTADCVVFDVMVHGYDPEPKLCRYGVKYEDITAPDAYYRRPNHVMAYRTSLSRQHLYKVERSGQDEDFDWAKRAAREIKVEERVEKVLYHYLFDPKNTTQVGVRRRGLKDVSFVVLQAVEHEAVRICLESVRKWAPGAEIVLVANGCPAHPEAAKLADKVVSLETNIGFAGGANRGAMEASRELVCFLNDDAAFVDVETPAGLAGAVGDTSAIVAPYSNAAKPPQGDIPLESVPGVDAFPTAVAGLCLMMELTKFRELGGFDTRLLTWEDDDLCLRAARRGWACRVVARTWIQHERHASFRALALDPTLVMEKNEVKFRRLHPKIRVVVIAKDEEGALEGFFHQFKDVTREFCVLDTGSTDGTRVLARKLGARVEQAPFEDFAQARNEALDRFGGGAEWIVMLDPDERLDEHTIRHLEALCASTTADILLAPLQAVYPDGSRRFFVSKPFAFRVKRDIRWVFKVHEKLIGSQAQALVQNALINHVISLHDAERRGRSERLYKELMSQEDYFRSPAFKARIREEWPILDYDRPDDPRIAKIIAGPLVSVVVSTYNRPELLAKALRSITRQDYPNLEVLVIGDACATLLESHGDPRVRILNLPVNHGAGGAVPRNYGIMLSSGSLIAYLDDDNEWTPDHVSSLYEGMRQTGAAYGFASMTTLGRDLVFKAPKKGSIDTSAVMHRRGLVLSHGWWKDRLEAGYAHDWELFSRWVATDEKWVATCRPTLLYNAETSGQLEFLKSVVEGIVAGA